MNPRAIRTTSEARAARAVVEAALDANGWRWNPDISRWLEVLVMLEEGDD